MEAGLAFEELEQIGVEEWFYQFWIAVYGHKIKSDITTLDNQTSKVSFCYLFSLNN